MYVVSLESRYISRQTTTNNKKMLSLSFSEEFIPVPRPSLVITSQKIHNKSATLLGMTVEMPIVLLSVWNLESCASRLEGRMDSNYWRNVTV